MNYTPKSVFISHASIDSGLAQQVTKILESNGTSCWIAPRDIAAGTNYNEAILKGIEGCTAMLLIMSEAANKSDHVMVELERAFNYKKVLIPLRVREVLPSKKLEYFISSAQWVDAISSPLSDRLGYVSDVVKSIEVNSPPPAIQPEKSSIFGRAIRLIEVCQWSILKTKGGLKSRKRIWQHKLFWIGAFIISLVILEISTRNSFTHLPSQPSEPANLGRDIAIKQDPQSNLQELSGIYEIAGEIFVDKGSEFESIKSSISMFEIPQHTQMQYLSWDSLNKIPVTWESARVRGVDNYFRSGVMKVKRFGKVKVKASGGGDHVKTLSFSYRTRPVANTSLTTLKSFISSQIGEERKIGLISCPANLFTGVAFEFDISSGGKKPIMVDFVYNKESNNEALIELTFGLSGLKTKRVC